MPEDCFTIIHHPTAYTFFCLVWQMGHLALYTVIIITYLPLLG